MFILLCADCTRSHNYAKILIAKVWCSGSLSSSDSFPPATFHSQRTLQSHTQIIENKWCISNAVGGNKRRAQACCAVPMLSHPAEPLDTRKTQLTLLENSTHGRTTRSITVHWSVHFLLWTDIINSCFNCSSKVARTKLYLDSKNVK